MKISYADADICQIVRIIQYPLNKFNKSLKAEPGSSLKHTFEKNIKQFIYNLLKQCPFRRLIYILIKFVKSKLNFNFNGPLLLWVKSKVFPILFHIRAVYKIRIWKSQNTINSVAFLLRRLNIEVYIYITLALRITICHTARKTKYPRRVLRGCELRLAHIFSN